MCLLLAEMQENCLLFHVPCIAERVPVGRYAGKMFAFSCALYIEKERLSSEMEDRHGGLVVKASAS